MEKAEASENAARRRASGNSEIRKVDHSFFSCSSSLRRSPLRAFFSVIFFSSAFITSERVASKGRVAFATLFFFWFFFYHAVERGFGESSRFLKGSSADAAFHTLFSRRIGWIWPAVRRFYTRYRRTIGNQSHTSARLLLRPASTYTDSQHSRIDVR